MQIKVKNRTEQIMLKNKDIPIVTYSKNCEYIARKLHSGQAVKSSLTTCLPVIIQNGMLFLQLLQNISVSDNSWLQYGHGDKGSGGSDIFSPLLPIFGGFLTTASIFFEYLGSISFR